MTQPTKEQIEAAAQAFVLWSENSEAIPTDELNDAIKAALTAAAEECPGCKAWANRYAFAKGIYEKELSEAKTEMKERCARVAENYDYDGYVIAAAIRAMKDDKNDK